MAEWTVELLEILPKDRILEIGFGPGVGIELAAKKANSGFVAGIDFSETMVAAARRRNSVAIRSGRVELKMGDASSLPYEHGSFEKIFAIHCIYFWSNPAEYLSEIYGVARAGGSTAITILPKEKWDKKNLPPADIFTLYSSKEVETLLIDAGFRKTRIEQYKTKSTFRCECIIGIK